MNQLALKSLILAMFVAGWLGAKAQELEIEAPAFRDKQVSVIRFNGLTTDTIAQLTLNESGSAVIGMKKEGFVLIVIEGKLIFPMIFSRKENRFRLGDNGKPDFTGFPQNDFFLRHLDHRKELLKQQRILTSAIATFSGDDSLSDALQNRRRKNEDELKLYSHIDKDSSAFIGAVYISAVQLLESSYSIHTEEDLVQTKTEFRNYIHDNYDLIGSGDMLQQFANQYMMMNEYALAGKERMENQVAQDIADWETLMKGHCSERKVVQYFLHYFISRMMVTMTGSVSEKLPDLSACPVQYEKVQKRKSSPDNTTLQLDAGMGSKQATSGENMKTVLILMDVDCPASVAGQVLFNRFAEDQKISVNVITVFCGRVPGQEDYRMLPKVDQTMFMPHGVTRIGDKAIKIKEYPAFIMMKNFGQVESIDYTLAGIRERFMKIKTAE